MLHDLIYLFILGFTSLSTHCIGHITTGSFMGRGNQYIQLIKILYRKLPTNGNQLPAFTLEDGPGTKPRSQRWETRVLPLPFPHSKATIQYTITCRNKRDVKPLNYFFPKILSSLPDSIRVTRVIGYCHLFNIFIN